MKQVKNVGPFLIALLLAAPVPAQDASSLHGTHRDAPREGTAENAVVEAMDRMMATMHGAAPTGDPDADFLLLMIPHHQSAVDMATALLPDIDDPKVEELARAVIAVQEAEIAAMQEILARLGHTPG